MELLDDILSDGLQTLCHLWQRVGLVYEWNMDEQTLALGGVQRLVVDKVTEIPSGILRRGGLQSNLQALLRHRLAEVHQVQAAGELGRLAGVRGDTDVTRGTGASHVRTEVAGVVGLQLQGQFLRQVTHTDMDDEVGLPGGPAVRNLLQDEVVLDGDLLHHHLVVLIIPYSWQSLHGLPAWVDIVASEDSEASHHYQHVGCHLRSMLSSISKSAQIVKLLVTKCRLLTNEAVFYSFTVYGEVSVSMMRCGDNHW